MTSFANVAGSTTCCDDHSSVPCRLIRVIGCEKEEKEGQSSSSQKWLDQAADLLVQQWPRGGPKSSYQEKIIHPYERLVEHCGLPCSYLLIQDDACIGHGRLTECFESAGGNAAAATFIVVDQNLRGCGLGRNLMHGMEQEAKRLGYHYVYLWTKTAIGFYEKIGYQECQRVSLKRACLKTLDSRQVETLEALLMKKSRRQSSGASRKPSKGPLQNPKSKKETILLPPGDEEDDNLPDVWLRKRLVEHVGSIHVSLDERVVELKDAIYNDQSKCRDWHYRLLSLPWQAQIGPSCGLAALRMVREYHFSSSSQLQQQQLPSLLGEAQERGYTNDGEVFNANHLKDLADKVCGIDCELWSTLEIQPFQVEKVIANNGVFILPYDSNARTRLPARLSGQAAHYGIVVGLLIGDLSSAASSASTTTTDESKNKISLHRRRGSNEDDDSSLPMETAATVCYLLVQHSLSSKLSIAPWSDFMESNQQLTCVDEGKYGQKDLDLKNRIIVCRGLRPDASFE